MNELNQFITNRTIQHLSAQEGESIVEIGPGNGWLSIPLLEVLGSNGHYLGIEMSRVMVAEANQNMVGKQCTAKILFGNCLDVAIKETSIDAVMAINILYFIEDLAPFFRKVISWIKPGGRAAFAVRSDSTLRNLDFTRYEFNIRSTDDIKLAMGKAGFYAIQSFTYEEGMTPFGETNIPVDSIILVGEIQKK